MRNEKEMNKNITLDNEKEIETAKTALQANETDSLKAARPIGEDEIEKVDKPLYVPKRPSGPGGGPPGGGFVGEKPKNFKASMVKLVKFMKPYYVPLIVAMVLAICGTMFNIVGPQYIGDIATMIQEGIFTGIDIDGIWAIARLLFVLYSLGAVLLYAQSFITATITQLVTKSMRSQLSAKLARLPLNYFDTNTTGDILSRLTNDVDTVGQSLSMSISTLLTNAVMFVGVLIMMFTVNWTMALTSVVVSILGFAIMIVIMARSRKHFIAMQKYLGELNGQVEETYSSLNVVKAYNAGESTVKTFTDTNRKLLNASRKANFTTSAMPSIMNFISNFGYVAVCIVGAVLVLEQGLDLGVIITFMIYIKLFTQPLSQLAQVGQSMQSVSAASERVFEFLEEDEMADESGNDEASGNDDESEKLAVAIDASDKKITSLDLESVKGDIEFKNVRFGYNENRVIIKDFSCSIPAGSKVAIVGPTGGGKTTIVNLLMRFYELNSGSIMVDGVDIKDLTRENVHALFSMVLQDTWMFDGTIRENIVYSKVDVSDEDVEKACTMANLHHFIHTLPHGLDTVMDDKTTLSAGQKQLITIARSMVDDAPMLIFDEATSSVDTRTEILIQEAMDALTKERTTFVIAHRLSTIKNSDIILVLKDGDIIEKGTHDELLAQNGFYAELYNSQFTKS